MIIIIINKYGCNNVITSLSAKGYKSKKFIIGDTKFLNIKKKIYMVGVEKVMILVIGDLILDQIILSKSDKNSPGHYTVNTIKSEKNIFLVIFDDYYEIKKQIWL